jgi:hypothetical protein
MKNILLIALLILSPIVAGADDKLSQLFSGERNVYLHVVLEKPNGFDIRSKTVPKEVIEKAEREGRQVRPTRTTKFVISYWALLADGTFKTFEQYNYGKEPVGDGRLTYTELETLFSTIQPLAKWKKSDVLSLGGTQFSLRSVESDDPGDAGKRGEIEVGWLADGKPVYFYYCVPLTK